MYLLKLLRFCSFVLFLFLDEKRLLQLYSRDEFLSEQTANARPTSFMRKQSNLFQKMNPQVVGTTFTAF